jgi:hypothetical protein
MKKINILFLLFLAIFGISSIASAVPMTWTDDIDFNPDVYVSWYSGYSYSHDITDDGFEPYIDGGDDYVTSYMLTVSLYDDGGRWDCGELAVIDQPGLLGDGLYNFNFVSQQFGWSLAGALQLDLTGELMVLIYSATGDFFIDSSSLVVYGDDGTAPVPEPATMLLLGTGLLGFGVSRRKKK